MTTHANPVLRSAPADPAIAAAHFAARLSLYTDVSDVHAAMEGDAPGFTLVDVRNGAAWEQGHAPGAVHLPHARIPEAAADLVDPSLPAVVYCWSPACDGGARGALALAGLGYRVKEMIGGMEYWVREGLPVETAHGIERQSADPRVAPASGLACSC
ncbi:rhodanese-like domain-containing protein [Nocardiopsis sp. NPDC050513]|uniref:rhodanese-like domain-containing protein n=1 Tax=Nocardiopsis sp. NPDC050513 TaxID=3364338 RepID=UPI0037AD6F38